MRMEQQLIAAVKAGKVEDVAQLLESHPELLGARGDNGASAILLAIYHRQPAVAQVFVDHGAPLDIFEASALGRVDRIATLLAEDPSRASAYADDGFYPVGLAAFFGHIDAVRALIAAGADVRAAARNPFQVQAVHAAAASGNLDLLRAVLEAGADANAAQQQGFRPLHEAATRGHREMAELLVSHGADPTLANDAGKNSIDFALEKGHTELVEWLEARRPK
jgi:ankyrin repeat protein